MSRQLSILIFIIFAFVNSYANAGDDGNLKLNENKNGYVEVGVIVLKKLIEEFLHSTKD